MCFSAWPVLCLSALDLWSDAHACLCLLPDLIIWPASVGVPHYLAKVTFENARLRFNTFFQLPKTDFPALLADFLRFLCSARLKVYKQITDSRYADVRSAKIRLMLYVPRCHVAFLYLYHQIRSRRKWLLGELGFQEDVGYQEFSCPSGFQNNFLGISHAII